jgi:hypothetical protein
MPSRTRLLFVDPGVAPDIGAAHQGPMALVALHNWTERCVGLKLPRAPGTLVERARFYWNRVPPILRKRAQLYIIRERRDTPWRFSDANPWRRGLRPVADTKPKANWKVDWAGLKPNSLYGKAAAGVQAAQAAQASTEPGGFYDKPRKKLKLSVPQQPKERLKIGIWS